MTTNTVSLGLYALNVPDSSDPTVTDVQPQLRDQNEHCISKSGIDQVIDQVTDGGTYQVTITPSDGVTIVSVTSGPNTWTLDSKTNVAESPTFSFEDFIKREDFEFTLTVTVDGSRGTVTNPEGWSYANGQWHLDPYVRLKRRTLGSPPTPDLSV